MPSRLTLTLDTNRKLEKIAILPNALPYADLVKLAAQKMKIKKVKSVKIHRAHDGKEVVDDEESLALTGRDCSLIVSISDILPVISKPKTKSPPPESSTPITILAKETSLDTLALTQLHQTASLPSMYQAVALPDLHPGQTHPIGCTFVTNSIVYPDLIGGDIGCGMAVFRLDRISSDMVDGKKSERIASRMVGVEGPWGDKEKRKEVMREVGLEEVGEEWGEYLGTIGGGNHFAEVQVVERVVDVEAAERIGVKEDLAYLLVHSGSRGLGQQILQIHKSPTGLSTSSPEFDQYLKAHNQALAFAHLNRTLIAHKILSTLTPCDTSAPTTAPSPPPGTTKLIDIWHNNVEPKQFSDGVERWIHRKGAAPSDKGPIVIPGSRGTFSYIVLPTGDQESNAFSLSHGAGRTLSRSKAHHILPTKHPSASTLRKTDLGSTVICDDKQLLYEEHPDAYKDVDVVVRDLEELGVCRVVAVLRPVVTYKMRVD
ncbi:hypothetical protein HK097_002691 [Rhizophlyctis rosea]|uniref:3'-phosphate/5'-hydroxy nucleic acid ligase n=1 Tax=Rhizophlyctis rosea TaxID=64517 RepID=A0AAD5S3A3_9FUNG|nr:hypothetical protein HK097_002691 [Rhizophlyctis rosea]